MNDAAAARIGGAAPKLVPRAPGGSQHHFGQVSVLTNDTKAVICEV